MSSINEIIAEFLAPSTVLALMEPRMVFTSASLRGSMTRPTVFGGRMSFSRFVSVNPFLAIHEKNARNARTRLFIVCDDNNLPVRPGVCCR